MERVEEGWRSGSRREKYGEVGEKYGKARKGTEEYETGLARVTCVLFLVECARRLGGSTRSFSLNESHPDLGLLGGSYEGLKSPMLRPTGHGTRISIHGTIVSNLTISSLAISHL